MPVLCVLLLAHLNPPSLVASIVHIVKNGRIAYLLVDVFCDCVPNPNSGENGGGGNETRDDTNFVEM